MAVYSLHKELDLAASLEELWDFISSPSNLEKITPPGMGFRIKTPQLPSKIYPGLMITYRLSPFRGIKMTWLTEISHVQDLSFFVDEQRSGPYKIWHHEHRLEALEKGVRMSDLVTYSLPLGPLGRLAQSWFIKSRLEAIFSYREDVLVNLFGRA